MANRNKPFYLLVAVAAFVISGLATACKQATVPADGDLSKAFQDNHSSFGVLVKLLMAEPNQKFSVIRGKGVTYPVSDKPPVSADSLSACQQVMTRTFCTGVRRDGGTAQFVFYEDRANDYFRSKSIVYDKDDFKDPVWAPKVTDTTNIRYVPIEPNWKMEYRYQKLK